MASAPEDLSAHVGTTVTISPRHLNLWPRNPRRGDVEGILESLLSNGQYSPLTVNAGTLTGRPNEVVTGNHTLKAFRLLAEQHPFDVQWHRIAVKVIDVSDDEAEQIVLIDNKSFDDGEGVDAAMVYEQLKDVGTAGTGYTDVEFSELEQIYEAEDPPGDGSPPPSDPEPPAPKEPPAIAHTITFDDEAQQDSWFGFVKWLREQYPDEDLTLAERLIAHLRDTESERV